MTKETSVLFTVTGKGTFPADMLRHDQCYPADTTSALAIVTPSGVLSRTVYLRHVSGWGDLAGPTVARWASFGWGVRIIRAHRDGEDVTEKVAQACREAA
jgi:hypothetical protein